MPASGVANSRWRGGRAMTGSGYPCVVAPEGHPRTDARGYIREHILVVERALGHYLRKSARVHHIDEDKTNNNPSNLVVCENDAYHLLLHQRLRAVEACGNANAIRCNICHSYDRQDDIMVRITGKKRRTYRSTYHVECNRAYQRDKRRVSVMATRPKLELVGEKPDPCDIIVLSGWAAANGYVVDEVWMRGGMPHAACSMEHRDAFQPPDLVIARYDPETTTITECAWVDGTKCPEFRPELMDCECSICRQRHVSDDRHLHE